MCVFAWRLAWFSGADLGRLRRHSIAMGAAHNELQWGNFLWTHLWIDHMYFFFCKDLDNPVKMLLLCHGGSHRRLKRMLCNSGGLSLLWGRLGVQVVGDNHTIDDSLAAHTWDATKRARHGPGPISVQRYVSHTRRRLLTDMQHLQTLERRFRCRKRRMSEYHTTPNHCCLWPGCMQACIGGGTLGVRANEGVDKGEIWMNSYEFARNSCEFV